MAPNRPLLVQAFSDGMIAIIITIMVLERQVPHGAARRRPALLAFLVIIGGGRATSGPRSLVRVF